MTAAQFDLGLRLAAYQRQTLVQRTSARRFDLQPDAMLVAVVASPGDHAGLWGVAWAPINGRPTVTSLGDPRAYAAQVELWSQIGKAWAGWLARHVADETSPQFVVADNSAADRIAWSARKIASNDNLPDHARAAARAFLIAVHASRATGQQSIAMLTEMMREHFVSGADPLDEGHLAHWTTWPNRKPGWDEPQVGLPPGADASDADLGRAWDKYVRYAARSRGDEMSQVFANNVAPHIHKLVRARWATLLAAVKVYQRHSGQPVAASAVRRTKDGRRWSRLMSEGRLPASRSVRARWVSLAERESSASSWKDALWLSDALERERGVAAGDILRGVAGEGRIVTRQSVLRIRPGDKLTTDGADVIVVRELDATPEGLVVVTDCPDLEGEVTAWPALQYVRSPIPKEVPWTHDSDAVPETFDLPGGDLMAQVAAMEAPKAP